jgi:hypothetical protein
MSKYQMKYSRNKYLASWIFGALTFAFLIFVYFFDHESVNHPILRFMASICAGLFGFFLSGNIYITIVNTNILSKIGKLTIQAGGGFALFMVIWFTWPTSPSRIIDTQDLEQVPSLEQADLFIRRSGNDSKVEDYPLIHTQREISTDSIYPLKNQDDLKLVARFTRPVYWYLIWFDTKGVVKIVAGSYRAERNVEYPTGKDFVAVDANDPAGLHLILLVASYQPTASLLYKIEKNLGKIGPPPSRLLQFEVELRGQRGSGSIRKSTQEFVETYLNTIDDTLPKGVEQILALFLPTEQRSR